MGVRTQSKMIEVFNLGPKSSVSGDEIQTKLPFGENNMDYRILLVYRDTGNHSAGWYPLVVCAWCFFVLFTHLEEYVVTMINVFYFWYLLRSGPLFSGVAAPRESLRCIAIPAACYRKLYVFQIIVPSGIMKYVSYWMHARWGVCSCVWVCVWALLFIMFYTCLHI